jgi:hypothetical protein
VDSHQWPNGSSTWVQFTAVSFLGPSAAESGSAFL